MSLLLILNKMKYLVVISLLIVVYSCNITKPKIKTDFFVNNIEDLANLKRNNDTLYLFFDPHNPKNYKRIYFNQFHKDKINKIIEFSFGDFENKTEIIHYKKYFSKYRFKGDLKIFQKPGYDEFILSDVKKILRNHKIINPKKLSSLSKEEVFNIFNGKLIYIVEPQKNGLVKIYAATQNLQKSSIP